MLSRSELKSLQAHRDYPSVSLLAATHRTAPANKQDPIKVKNLVGKAVARLHREFSKREVAPVVKNLQDLVRKVDWKHTLDGLALFAGRERSAAVSMLAGNHDETSPSELGKLAWQVFDSAATQRRTQALDQLDEAVSENLHASGIDQVWRAAAEANCRFLLVEKDFKYPADLSSLKDVLAWHMRGFQFKTSSTAVTLRFDGDLAARRDVGLYNHSINDLPSDLGSAERSRNMHELSFQPR